MMEACSQDTDSPRRIVIVGAGGRLGRALERRLGKKHSVIPLNHEQLDLGAGRAIADVLERFEFDVLLLPAALTAVDYCETNEEEAYAVNAAGPGEIARICRSKGARMVHISTDFVFDGLKAAPYTEDDRPNPLSVYGASKLKGEENVLAVSSKHLVVRLSWVFGAGKPAFPEWIIEKACAEMSLSLPEDKISCPSYTADVAHLLEPLLFGAAREDAAGIVHLSNSQPCTWRQWGQFCIDAARESGFPVKARRIEATKLESIAAFVAKRPENSALDTTKYTRLTGIKPRSWQDAVREYLRSPDFPVKKRASRHS